MGSDVEAKKDRPSETDLFSARAATARAGESGEEGVR